jgi:hypothetical protein
VASAGCGRGAEAASSELTGCGTGLEWLGGDPWSSILELLDLATPRKEVGGGCLVTEP